MYVIIGVVFLVVFHVICGLFTSTIATEKSYDKTRWFLAGLLLGPWGIIASCGLPDKLLREELKALASKSA